MESKKDTNELIYKTEYRLTDIENKLMVTTGDLSLKQKKRTKAQSSKQPLSDSVALTCHPEVVTHSTDLLLG